MRPSQIQVIVDDTCRQAAGTSSVRLAVGYSFHTLLHAGFSEVFNSGNFIHYQQWQLREAS